MKNVHFKLIKILAVSVIVLGCIHLAATPVIISGLGYLKTDDKTTFLFMFVAAGLGIILPGITIVNQLSELKAEQIRAYKLCVICSLYILLFGIMAVATMYTNPFAYVTLLLGILLFIPLMKSFL